MLQVDPEDVSENPPFIKLRRGLENWLKNPRVLDLKGDQKLSLKIHFNWTCNLKYSFMGLKLSSKIHV